MAEDRLIAVRENGSVEEAELARVLGERESAAMQTVQPPQRNPVGDCVVAHAGGQELASRDHTVLVRRELRDHQIRVRCNEFLGL